MHQRVRNIYNFSCNRQGVTELKTLDHICWLHLHFKICSSTSLSAPTSLGSSFRSQKVKAKQSQILLLEGWIHLARNPDFFQKSKPKL